MTMTFLRTLDKPLDTTGSSTSPVGTEEAEPPPQHTQILQEGKKQENRVVKN